MYRNYTSYRFFVLYSMLLNRGTNIKLMHLGYNQIRRTLEYVAYQEVYNVFRNGIIGDMYEERFSDDMDEMCNASTGIKMSYVKDPINAFKIFVEREKLEFNDCKKLAFNGYLECLRFGFDISCEPIIAIMQPAIEGNSLSCLEFLICKWKNSSMFAARSLLRLPRMPCAACTFAASLGSLECLKMLRLHKFAWGSDTIVRAAQYGHYECLKWAHENGCPVHGFVFSKDKRCREYIERYMNK